MWRVLVPAVLVVSLAGCSSDVTPIEEEQAPPVACGAVQIPAETPGYQAMTLMAQAGPDAPIRSFIWKVPPDAVQSVPQEFGPARVGVPFHIELEPAVARSLTNFALLGFAIGETAETVYSHLDGPRTIVETSLIDRTESTDDVEPVSNDFVVPGECFAWIIAAESSTPMPLPIHIVPHDEFVSGDWYPTEFWPNAQGTGMHLARHLGIDFGGPLQARHTWHEGDASVQDSQAGFPAVVAGAGLREVTLSTAWTGASGGYTAMSAGLGGTNLGAGRYVLEAQSYGQTVSASGPFVQNPTYTTPNTGFSYRWASEGEGHASQTFSFQWAQANTIATFGIIQFDLGATLTELLGVPPAAGLAIDPDLVDELRGRV